RPDSLLSITASALRNPNTYTPGYHPSTTRSHATSTASNSAAFLRPLHLFPPHIILEVGCGPGSITRSLCAHIPHGSITGIYIGNSVFAQAKSLASSSSSEVNDDDDDDDDDDSPSPRPRNLFLEISGRPKGHLLHQRQIQHRLLPPKCARARARPPCAAPRENMETHVQASEAGIVAFSGG
ncbi:hypothetical protein LTS18_003778, partial [Coniosporium uncinatum]